ncbi:MAG: imelysin family protein [Candidatus Kapabacteria bacterium]|nr:imelysin family protein [Candidatus Kapabacteria bacterium]
MKPSTPVFIFLFSLITCVICACDDSGNSTQVDRFDRQAMLKGVADKLIIPSFAELHARATEVVEQTIALADNSTPTVVEIERLRKSVSSLTVQWQKVISYNFGPAEGPLGTLVENVSTFPVNTSAIETFIAEGDTTFQNFRRDTRGLSALDYLLFNGTAEEVTTALRDVVGANRRSYVKAVANAILVEVSIVHSAWVGPYRQSFIDRSGTDAGSSLSLVFNHFNIGYELLKNFKIALPLGKRAGQSTTEPLRVEAYHQATSLQLARAQFDAVVDLWYGRTATGDTFPSFRAYLKTVAYGDRLIADTENQIIAVTSAFDALGTSTSLSVLVSTNPGAVEPLNTQLQKLTRFFKSEMSSLLGISITYSSGDGD